MEKGVRKLSENVDWVRLNSVARFFLIYCKLCKVLHCILKYTSISMLMQHNLVSLPVANSKQMRPRKNSAATLEAMSPFLCGCELSLAASVSLQVCEGVAVRRRAAGVFIPVQGKVKVCSLPIDWKSGKVDARLKHVLPDQLCPHSSSVSHVLPKNFPEKDLYLVCCVSASYSPYTQYKGLVHQLLQKVVEVKPLAANAASDKRCNIKLEETQSAVKNPISINSITS